MKTLLENLGAGLVVAAMLRMLERRYAARLIGAVRVHAPTLTGGDE